MTIYLNGEYQNVLPSFQKLYYHSQNNITNTVKNLFLGTDSPYVSHKTVFIDTGMSFLETILMN